MITERANGRTPRGHTLAGLLLSLTLLLAACDLNPNPPASGPTPTIPPAATTGAATVAPGAATAPSNAPAPAPQGDGQINRDALFHYSRDHPTARSPPARRSHCG